MNLRMLEVHQVFRTILSHVEMLTGLASRWDGTIHLSEEVDIGGHPRFTARKDLSCSLTVHQSFLHDPKLYGTLVHESLHAVSVGVTRAAYDQFQGYEEGVVEKVTRLLGPHIAAAMGIAYDFGTRTSYLSALGLLEQLRAKTGRAEEEFYLELLKTPLAQREQTVVQWTMEASPNMPRARVLAQIAAISRGLK